MPSRDPRLRLRDDHRLPALLECRRQLAPIASCTPTRGNAATDCANYARAYDPPRAQPACRRIHSPTRSPLASLWRSPAPQSRSRQHSTAATPQHPTPRHHRMQAHNPSLTQAQTPTPAFLAMQGAAPGRAAEHARQRILAGRRRRARPTQCGGLLGRCPRAGLRQSQHRAAAPTDGVCVEPRNNPCPEIYQRSVVATGSLRQ